MINLRREKVQTRAKICSDNFLEKHLSRWTIGGRTLWKPGAVPTRFKKFASHLQKKTVERRPLVLLQLDTQPIDAGVQACDATAHESISTSTETPRSSLQIDTPSPASNNVDTLRTLKRYLKRNDIVLESVRKRRKVNQQKNRRLKKKMITLESLIKELRDKDLLSRNGEKMLDKSFSPESKAIFWRIIKRKGLGKGCKYPPELKSFALTLQFYSSKAYEFVRQKLKKDLPHQSVIRK